MKLYFNLFIILIVFLISVGVTDFVIEHTINKTIHLFIVIPILMLIWTPLFVCIHYLFFNQPLKNKKE